MNLGICLYFWQRTLWDSRAQQRLFHTLNNPLPTAMPWRGLRSRQEDCRARVFLPSTSSTDAWVTGVLLSSKYLVLKLSFSLAHLSVSYFVIPFFQVFFLLQFAWLVGIFSQKVFISAVAVFFCSSGAHSGCCSEGPSFLLGEFFAEYTDLGWGAESC